MKLIKPFFSLIKSICFFQRSDGELARNIQYARPLVVEMPIHPGQQPRVVEDRLRGTIGMHLRQRSKEQRENQHSNQGLEHDPDNSIPRWVCLGSARVLDSAANKGISICEMSEDYILRTPAVPLCIRGAFATLACW